VKRSLGRRRFAHTNRSEFGPGSVYFAAGLRVLPNLTVAAIARVLLRLKGIEAPRGMRVLVDELLDRVNLRFAAKRK
jgi:hypothetical protein